MANKTVTKREMTTIHMVQGGERKHSRVIVDGRVMNWVGFGWVDEGEADAYDRRVLPTAVED